MLKQSNNCACFISQRRTWQGDADFPSAYDAKGDRRNRRSDENYSGPDCTWSMVVWWPTSPWACGGQWASGRKHEWSGRFVSESADQWGGREQAKRGSVYWLASLTRTRWLLLASLCEKCTISPWLIKKDKAGDAFSGVIKLFQGNVCNASYRITKLSNWELAKRDLLVSYPLKDSQAYSKFVHSLLTELFTVWLPCLIVFDNRLARASNINIFEH